MKIVSCLFFFSLFGCQNLPSRTISQEPSSTVTFELVEGEIGSAQIWINSLADNNPLKFQLDTGANRTFIENTNPFDKYEIIGHGESSSASGITVTTDKIRIQSLKLGSIEKTNFDVVRYAKESKLKNRMGMDALVGNIVFFDFKNKTLSFNKDIPKDLSQNKLTMYFDSSFGFDVHFDNQTILSIWDTGAELSVIDQDFIKANPHFFNHVQTINNGVDATGHPVKLELYQFKNLKLSNNKINGLVMGMDFKPIHEKMGPDIKFIIGTNLMRSNNWYFDLIKKTWAVE